MTEAEFAAIRERWRDLEGAYPGMVHLDIATLIRAVEERDAIIHDLQLDGSALARRAVEEFIVKAIEWGKEQCKHHSHRLANLANLGGASGMIASDFPDEPGVGGILRWLEEELVQSCPDADPLPPDQVRRENERLRERLRAIRCRVEDYLDTLGNCGGKWAGVEAALNRLREMASEEATR